MKTLLSALSTFIVLVVHAPAHADFHRADFVDPDTIFSQGFQPWGNNRNLFQHVAGITCSRQNEAQLRESGEGTHYVSMAATQESAERVAKIKLAQTRVTAARPEPRIWVYDIRPATTTYNVGRTFERADVNLTRGPMRGPYQNALFLDEWVEDGAIPPERIREARQYRLVNGQAVEVPDTGVTNPRYVDVETVGNPDPMPASVITGIDTAAQRARAVIGTAATRMVSACWCSTPNATNNARPSRAVSTTADDCEITYFNEVVPSVRYFPTDGWEVTLN